VAQTIELGQAKVSPDQSPAGSPSKVSAIHALRGVAALLVVWSHLSGFWLLSNGQTSIAQSLWQDWIVTPFHVYQNAGHLGVVLFFLISGYVITLASLRETRAQFAIKRIMRIAPALVVAVLVSGALLALAYATSTNLIGVNGGSPLHWIESLVLVDGFFPGGFVIDVTWTLVVEVVFYLMTFAFLSISKVTPLKATWLMAGVWVVLSVISLNVGFISSRGNGWAAFYVAFLLVGRLIFLAQRRLIAYVDGAILVAVVLTLYMLFVERAQPGFLLAPGGWKGIEPLVAYVTALLAFLALLRWNPARLFRPFRFFGDISYSLYLLHLPVGITVLNLLFLAHVPNDLNVVVAIAVAIAVAYLSYRFVERPSQRWARAILKKIGTRGASAKN